MSRARRNRYRLRWCRYANRAAELGAGPNWGMARAVAPFYRNGAALPYGWQPRAQVRGGI